jgi:DNA-binding transcriptional regulator YiaG
MDIEALRIRAGLSREELAEALDISEASIRNWEGGRTEPTMNPSRYAIILEILKCTPHELADATDLSMQQRRSKKPGRPKLS